MSECYREPVGPDWLTRQRAGGRVPVDPMVTEGAEAWIWTPQSGAYPLGPMREGLGWVSEANVCRGAESNRDHIYFVQWVRGE